ncbi:MAG: GNAT family N-acetyltransferase [Chloroflexi bacterium]|nr:GNAT family N-acetyltransferase [Chloroflexota bacterium]
MTDIRVRNATRADIERISEFQQAMALETEGRKLDSTVSTQGIIAIFDDPRKGFYIVAVADAGSAAQVVASLMITYEWSDWNNANHWWIQSVYVDAAWRRKGVYRTMYDHILGMTRDRSDICSIRLYVERTNTTAQQTYKSLGMSHSHYDMYEIDLSGH